MISIIVTLSFPAFRSFFIHQHVSYYTQELESLIEFAREQAQAKGESMVLCSSQDGLQCDSHGKWDGFLLVRSRTEVLKRSQAFSKGYQLHWAGGFSGSSLLRFEATGFTEVEQGSFYICPPIAYAHLAKALIVLKSGRLRVSHDYSKLAGICR